MDLEGFEMSIGSACNSGTLKPSRVLLSMGYPEHVALYSIRVCLGIENTPSELEAFVDNLIKRIQHIRKMRAENSVSLARLELEQGVF